MEIQNILSADPLDILFEGKNKSYGAYELRKSYKKRIVYAMSGTFFICLLFIGGSILAGNKKSTQNEIVIANIVLENFRKEEKKETLPKPLPKTEPPRLEISQFTPPKITIDEEVKPEEEVRDMQILEETKIGTINRDGMKDEGVVALLVEKIIGVVDPPKKNDEIDGEFHTVQIEARFPGGMSEWNKYLQRNLNNDLPSENGAPPADYAVIVSFVVDRNGVISDVRAENDPGYGTKAEAIRVILKGPKWIPAEQNGRSVVYRQKQKITFRVSE